VTRPPTILAMGGGGFTMEPDNPALDEFVLTLSARQVPRLLFLPTASGDALAQVARFHATFDDRPCETRVLSIFRLGETGGVPLRDLILAQDIVYVGGGSMRSLLAIWREYELDVILREAWASGVVLAGLSAGAMCWFTGGVTMSTGLPAPVAGLGLLPGSLSVHADTDEARLPVFEAAVRDGRLPAGWLADDGAGLLFRDSRLERVVSSRARARVVHVCRDDDGGLVRTQLAPDLLTAAPRAERPVTADVLEFRRAHRSSGRR
jgi:dipeptidase E